VGSGKAIELADVIRSKKPEKVRSAFLLGFAAELPAKVLLVVDQFEEFRTSPDAQAYIDTLLRLGDVDDDTIRVVLTMRRDFYYLCAGYPVLYQRLERNERHACYHLRRIAKESIGDCVTEPLRLANVGLADRQALAQAVIRDAGDEPGELALLQMALWRTWSHHQLHRDDLLRAYNAIGRVEGALAQAAAEVYGRLDERTEQSLAEGLFVRLVRPGEAGGATRRIARKEEFNEASWALASKLADYKYERLVTLGEDAVEVTHEALATQWDLYQRWIGNAPGDPRGDDLRLLQRLIERTREWRQANERKAEFLAVGHDLETYSDLSRRRGS
jgi:hypothetical protein